MTGNGDPGAPETPVMIDVDAKRTPSLDQALEFLRDLGAEPEFSGLFFDPSPSVQSAHGYFVLAKQERGISPEGCGQPRYTDARGVNEALNGLQAHRRHRLTEQQRQELFGDLTDVGVKITCMTTDRDRRGRFTRVNCGQLGKLPEAAFHRQKEFLGMARVPEAVIRRLGGEALNAPRGPVSTRKTCIEDAGSAPGRTFRGSTRSHPIPRRVIERIGSEFSVIAHQLMPEPIRTSGRHVATTEDMAIFLAIAGWISRGQGASPAMPIARIQALRTAMYQAGEVTRPCGTT